MLTARGAPAGVASNRLKVGVHVIGFVAVTTDIALASFYPGWAEMWSKLGRERGWPQPIPAQFEALCAPEGPYLIGGTTIVTDKLRRLSDDLGGVARVNLQMSSASDDHTAMLRAIELLRSEVAPLVQ